MLTIGWEFADTVGAAGDSVCGSSDFSSDNAAWLPSVPCTFFDALAYGARAAVAHAWQQAFHMALAFSTWPGGRNTHFDVTVEELLDLTAQKTLKYASKGNVRGPRGYPICLCLQSGTGEDSPLSDTGKLFSASGDGPPATEVGTDEAEHDEGISTILIETGSEG